VVKRKENIQMSNDIQTDSDKAVGSGDLLGRTLELTIKRQWFDMVSSGEKKEEYRKSSKWIGSRLFGKDYDTVRFRNGYRADSPVCVCEYLGWTFGMGKRLWGGGVAPGEPPLIVIKLGRVIVRPNEKS
jgi:hypothetical protein